MKPEDFIALLAEPAQASMRATGVPASFTLAQAALESAWGESGLAKSGMNLFGVKADTAWNGATLALPTRECLDGQWVTVPALWRKYTTWGDCLTDHARFFVMNKRYAPAFAHASDAELFARAVAVAGYATDPDYAAKLIALMRLRNLTQFDQLT